MAIDREDNLLAAAYAKDPEDEAFLSWLNEVLAPLEQQRYRDIEDRLPTVHVLGCPRSGTTLLTQLIASHLRVGPINNLIAAFWRAPTIGIRLSKRFITPGQESAYQSDYGRTAAIHEPHEFGYFWSTMLGYRVMGAPSESERAAVDWIRLRRVLVQMTHAYGVPVVFKPLMLMWHVAELIENLPRSCVLWIRRDPVDNALSLLEARKKYSGDVNAWLSLRPDEYAWLKDEPVERQVAGQVVFLERALRQELDRAKWVNCLEIHYDELCADPAEQLEQIGALIAVNGGSGSLLGPLPGGLRRRGGPAGDHQVRDAIAAAITEFEGT